MSEHLDLEARAEAIVGGLAPEGLRECEEFYTYQYRTDGPTHAMTPVLGGLIQAVGSDRQLDGMVEAKIRERLASLGQSQ